MTPEPRSESGSESPVERARARLSEARERLADAERALGEVQADTGREDPPAPQTVEPSWRERLWQAPAECRIGVEELSEALGRSPSWIYARTQQDADPRLPHGKLSGSLTFRCGEVRAWIRDTEDDVVGYRMEPAPGELRVEGRAS